MTQFIVRSLPSQDRNDDGRGAYSPPETAPADFFLSASHDLFAIGALHRAQAEAFNRALSACSANKQADLMDALTLVRDRAERIVTLAAMLKVKTEAPDLFEDATQVYGERDA